MQYEWLGIVGSILIIIAFVNKDEKKIRILDCIGAVLFILYGFVTKTWSTMFLNAVLVLVHLSRFREMKRGECGKRTESSEGRSNTVSSR